MNNEQENKNEEEIQIIVEEGNDNAEYLKNRKTKGDYSKITSVENKSITTEDVITQKITQNFDSITTMSIISKIFYGFSILSIIVLFIFLSKIEFLSDIEFMSIQFYIICSYFGSAFMFFSFGELFNVVNRIDKNTKK